MLPRSTPRPEGPGRAEDTGPERPGSARGARPERTGRAWGRAIGFGLLAGALTGFALVGLVAAPLYLWAKATEPELGLQRPLVRNGLRLAPFLGLVAFLVTASLSARWRLRDQARGGREPE